MKMHLITVQQSIQFQNYLSRAGVLEPVTRRRWEVQPSGTLLILSNNNNNNYLTKSKIQSKYTHTIQRQSLKTAENG